MTDDRLSIEGVVSVEVGDVHVTFRRLDDRWRHELPVEVDFLAESPTGVRVAFCTDSRRVTFEFLATMLDRNGERRPSRFDLVIGGEVVATQVSEAGNTLVLDAADPSVFELVPGDVGTVEFDLSGDAGRRVELWMPPATVLRAYSLSIDDGASMSAPPPSQRRRWVHHGSSISHCMEAHGGAQVWPAVAARIADVDLTNLGLAGQCQLDQFTARTIRDLPADLLSLKVGINLVNAASMNLRTFPSALHGFLDTVREGHPDAPFLVVSPIICPVHEDTPGPTGPQVDGKVTALGTKATKAQGALTLRLVRRLVSEVVEVRRGAGDRNLHHLDGLELFGPDDVEDLPDGLHPNGDGYVRIGERFAALALAAGAAFAAG